MAQEDVIGFDVTMYHSFMPRGFRVQRSSLVPQPVVDERQGLGEGDEDVQGEDHWGSGAGAGGVGAKAAELVEQVPAGAEFEVDVVAFQSLRGGLDAEVFDQVWVVRLQLREHSGFGREGFSAACWLGWSWV